MFCHDPGPEIGTARIRPAGLSFRIDSFVACAVVTVHAVRFGLRRGASYSLAGEREIFPRNGIDYGLGLVEPIRNDVTSGLLRFSTGRPSHAGSPLSGCRAFQGVGGSPFHAVEISAGAPASQHFQRDGRWRSNADF